MASNHAMNIRMPNGFSYGDVAMMIRNVLLVGAGIVGAMSFSEPDALKAATRKELMVVLVVVVVFVSVSNILTRLEMLESLHRMQRTIEDFILKPAVEMQTTLSSNDMRIAIKPSSSFEGVLIQRVYVCSNPVSFSQPLTYDWLISELASLGYIVMRNSSYSGPTTPWHYRACFEGAANPLSNEVIRNHFKTREYVVRVHFTIKGLSYELTREFPLVPT